MLNQMNLSKILSIFLPSDLILRKELLKDSFFIERVRGLRDMRDGLKIFRGKLVLSSYLMMCQPFKPVDYINGSHENNCCRAMV